MNMTLLSTAPSGKPLKRHTATGDALFAAYHTPFHLQCGTWESLQIAEINISLYILLLQIYSFRPFFLCVSLALPLPLDLCLFRLLRLCCLAYFSDGLKNVSKHPKEEKVTTKEMQGSCQSSTTSSASNTSDSQHREHPLETKN